MPERVQMMRQGQVSERAGGDARNARWATLPAPPASLRWAAPHAPELPAAHRLCRLPRQQLVPPPPHAQIHTHKTHIHTHNTHASTAASYRPRAPRSRTTRTSWPASRSTARYCVVPCTVPCKVPCGTEHRRQRNTVLGLVGLLQFAGQEPLAAGCGMQEHDLLQPGPGAGRGGAGPALAAGPRAPPELTQAPCAPFSSPPPPLLACLRA